VYAFDAQAVASLSITADELELFYVELSPDGQDNFISVLSRSARSAAFMGPPVRVPALQAACAPGDYPSLDVTNDGLRIYITCLDGGSPLRTAARASRSADWVVAPDPVGMVGDSISVSDDELTAAAVVDLATNAPRPVLYRRGSRSEPFGNAETVPTVNDSFMNPDLAADGRQLFGVGTGSNGRSRILVSTRTSTQVYPAPSYEGMPVPPSAIASSVSDFTPTVTPDCRSMYFLRRLGLDVGVVWTLELSQR
jgi:hypothetical protein